MNKTACKYCWSEDIFLREYWWAYDWALEIECKDCKRRTHRFSWHEIISSLQLYEYWPVLYELESDDLKHYLWITRDVYEGKDAL